MLVVRLLVAVLLALAACTGAHALDPRRALDEYTVTSWTMEDGLPHNLILGMTQDAEGFIWVGTWEGAARFNGRTFTVLDAYTVPDMRLLGVRSIVRDRDDAMLFGTAQYGVIRHAGTTWETLGGTAGAALRVTTLLRARNGDLWIGTEHGLHRLDTAGVLHEPEAGSALDAVHIFSLLERPDGSLLVGTYRELLRIDGDTIERWGNLHALPQGQVRTLVGSRDGMVIAGGDGGAWRIDPDGQTTRLLDIRVESMIEDREGALWISTASQGLLRLVGDRFDRFTTGALNDGRGSTALMQDREGLIWFGTTNGLRRVTDGPAHGIVSNDGLGHGYVRTILETADHTLWIGHADGLDRMRDGKIEGIALPGPGTKGSSVLALGAASDGGVWLGTYDRGALRIPGDSAHPGDAPTVIDQAGGLPSNHVRAVLEDVDGSLWIGSTGGLTHWRDGTFHTYTVNDGLPADFVRALHRSADGTLWIGTPTGIAARSPDGRFRSWKPGDGFPAMGSFDFLEDPDGTIWVASDGGLLRLRDGRFSVYDHRLGLPRNTVFRVLDDHQDHLWLSSNHGVFRVARSSIDEVDAGTRQQLVVDVIDRNDGMPSSQTNGGSSPAGWAAMDGTIWFPTAAGVAVIDPRRVGKPSDNNLPVAIERIGVDSAVQPTAKTIALDTHARRLAIGYTGLHFRAPGNLRYRYRLVGFDDRWLDAGTTTEAVYTNLPPGTFRFEVQAALTPVDWSDATPHATTTLEVVVATPFWRSGWFIGLVAVGVLLLLDGLYRWRSATLRGRQRRLADIIEQRTSELRAKNEALEQATLEREKLMQQLAHLALHDSLTGLPNRRAGDAYLPDAIDKARHDGGKVSIGLLDIDHFKRINDEHGHAVGDAVLRAVADMLRRDFGNEVFAARHGGEEFLIVLGGLTADQALERFEQVRSRIAASGVAGGVRCTVSIGVAHSTEAATPRDLLAMADRRLYRAKRAGRDRVVAEDIEV